MQLYGGGSVPAYTLSGGLPFDLPPSPRYMSLLREGARELELTPAWQERLAAVETAPFGTPAPERSSNDFERSDSVFV